MTRTKARLLEVATWWMPAYMVLFLVVWFVSFVGMMGIGALGPALDEAGLMLGGVGLMGIWALIIPLHLLTMLLAFALLVVYAYLAFTNEDLDKTQQLLWVIVCFVGGPIGQLFYLYREVKPRVR